MFIGVLMPFSTLLRSLSGFLIALLIGKISFAQTTLPVLHETALLLPWSFVEQSLQTQAQSDPSLEQFAMGPITLQAQGIPVTIPQAVLQMQLHLKPVVSSQNATRWESDQLILQINVGGIQVQKDIVQNIGGVQAIVHLSAQCAPFTLVQPSAHILTNWLWQASGLVLGAMIQDLSLDWPQNSWQIGSLECQGPKGFADLVQADLQSQLAQADQFAPLLKTALENALNSKIQAWLTKWRAPKWIPQSASGQGMNLLLSGVETVRSQGLLFKGVVGLGPQMDLASLLSAGAMVIPLGESDALLAQITLAPTLIFSSESLSSVISQVSLWPKVDINLNAVSSFESLLKNWFIEIFIWPDLLNYSSKAAFHMISQLSAPAAFQFSAQGTAGSPALPSASFKASVQSLMTAVRDGQTWNYLLFQSQVSANVSMAIASGQLNLQFANTNLQSKAKFGVDYVHRYSPSKYISLSTIESALKSSTALKTATLALPKFQLSDAVTLQATKLLRPANEFFFVELGPN
jgi:hypothetical protein